MSDILTFNTPAAIRFYQLVHLKHALRIEIAAPRGMRYSRVPVLAAAKRVGYRGKRSKRAALKWVLLELATLWLGKALVETAELAEAEAEAEAAMKHPSFN